MSKLNLSWAAVVEEHQRVIAGTRDQGEALDAISDAIVAAFRAGNRLYVLGNGGSAADAQHIAAELVGRFKQERTALPAVALTTDSSGLTAIGNDYGFERVFERQVAALVRAGDIVWAISTSGNSPNVLRAARAAAERGALLIGFTGAGGGDLAPLCPLVFRAAHGDSDRIQEAHQLAYHYVCGRVEAAFSGQP